MLDLDNIIFLVLFAFDFTPKRSHHLLTLTRSRLMDSAAVNPTPGDGTIAIKVEYRHVTDQLFLQNGKKLRGVQEEQLSVAQNTSLWHS